MGPRHSISALALWAVAGCASAERPRREGEALFPIALKVKVQDPSADSGVASSAGEKEAGSTSAVASPAGTGWHPTGENWKKLSNPRALQSFLTEQLYRSGLFATVDEAGSWPQVGDVELSVKWENFEEASFPFGEGKNLFGRSILSTIAWLLGGVGSWWIVDRQFPAEGETAPVLRYRIEDRVRASEIKGFDTNPIELSDLGLSMIDRHDWRLALLWNLVLPPWTPPNIISPDRERLSESLAEQGLERIRSALVQDIETGFGTWYARKVGTVLLFEEGMAAGRRAKIASKERVIRVDAYDPSAKEEGEWMRVADYPAEEELQLEKPPLSSPEWESLKRFAPGIEAESGLFEYWYLLDLARRPLPRVNVEGGRAVILRVTGIGGKDLCRWTVPVTGG